MDLLILENALTTPAYQLRSVLSSPILALILPFYNAFALIDSLGNIYVLVTYDLGTQFVARVYSYNSTGTFLNARNVFTPVGTLTIRDLVIDSSNNLYLSLEDDATGRGAYLKKLTTAGTTLWTKRIEPASSNSLAAFALSIDSANNVYVTGQTLAAFPGFTNQGDIDAFALKYSPAGTRLWAFQIGGNSLDSSLDIAVSDAVYLTGHSSSNPNLLGDTNHCNCFGTDAFLIRLDIATGTLLGIDQ